MISMFRRLVVMVVDGESEMLVSSKSARRTFTSGPRCFAYVRYIQGKRARVHKSKYSSAQLNCFPPRNGVFQVVSASSAPADCYVQRKRD